jgi:hypothetical protein
MFFKILERAIGLRMVARTGGKLAIAHGPKFPAQGLLGDGDLELLVQPLAEIDDPPTDDAVDRRRWPAFDHRSQGRPACAVEPGRRDCQDFRVRAAIMNPKEVLDGTTQSSPHS